MTYLCHTHKIICFDIILDRENVHPRRNPMTTNDEWNAYLILRFEKELKNRMEKLQYGKIV